MGRVGGEIARFAGHELVGGASRAGRVGKAMVGRAGAVALAGTGKVVGGTLGLVTRVRGRTPRDLLEEELRRRPRIRTLEAPVLVLSGPLGTGWTPARTQESQAGTDSATECAEPAAAEPTRAEPGPAVSTRAEPAARSTRARTAPEPPPERPGSAREAAGVKKKARGISRD